MKLDVTPKLTTLDGEEIQIIIQPCPLCGRGLEDRGVRTLRNTCVDALFAQFRDEIDLTGSEKVKRYDLALRLHKQDKPILEANEVVLVKMVVGKMFGPLVVGQVWEMLDPKE